ncbi:MAG: BON domain-containing protein, partial [Verrucomicrobiaceae bacterium]
ALAKDSRVTEEGIDVSLKDGIVTLKGEVGSVAEKDAVESTSRVIPGVLRVSNQLKVSKDFASAARQTATIPVASSPPVLKPGP